MATTSFKKPGMDKDTMTLIGSGALALVAIVTLVFMLMNSGGVPETEDASAPAATAPSKGGADAGGDE